MKSSIIEQKNIFSLLAEEKKRQKKGIHLIASENETPHAVHTLVGSVLMNKYAEGYPGARYYTGNSIIDEIERSAIRAACTAFNAEHANVQPHSGSTANEAIFDALLQPGDTILSLSLDHGGHLTHGHPKNNSGKKYNFVHYFLDPTTHILDYSSIEKIARTEKPKLIICGFTAYPRMVSFEKFGHIARTVNAYAMADISHIAGLIATGLHPQPFPHMDVVMSTTHKTLRGPRGAIILSRASLAKAIDNAVFPGHQGGPFMNVIAGKAWALWETQKKLFITYQKKILSLAKAMTEECQKRSISLISGGTDTHMILIDTQKTWGCDGATVATLLEKEGIYTNCNLIPYDTGTARRPSGLRLGTAWIASRSFTEKNARAIISTIDKIVRLKLSKIQ